MNMPPLTKEQSARLLEQIIHELQGKARPKCWMSASALARVLLSEWPALTEAQLTAQINTLLREHASQEGRKLRWCWYPSPRTLEMLWGHIKVVGEKAVPSYELQTQPLSPLATCQALPDDAPTWFISHNSQDQALCVALCEALASVQVNSWLCEFAIAYQENISDAIVDGLQRAHGVLLVLSERSLKSTWVNKEYQQVNGLPCIIVIPKDDKLLSVETQPPPRTFKQLIEIKPELFTQEQYECWYHLGFTQQTDHPVYFWEEAGNNQALLEVIKNIPNNNK
ncbi:toll/interleukin-1 receptor domain-containing protein [Pseudoalteromonas rubra]|uniref:TIR domain-containing protein n=1 Tax=Pseudoalteromonas rubra TaxID=43658 RepID=A0A5S3X0D6_9GAMM|nr:toll/interleukin-1 receptor domain-containing protein [Pseudoalteromonas rubra]TMP37437.1 hypothetical protein CWB98_09650 [Pseudoalteromonas rubra]